jgi:lysophospholipase L1-like esterase
MEIKQNAVILFQGDSVTDMGRDRADPNSPTALGFGYPQALANYLTYRFPEKSLRVFNRADSGDKITNLYARIKADIINVKPDILTLLVGVNDVLHEFLTNDGVSAEKFGKVYRMLLDEVIAELPNVQLVIMEPFFLPVGMVKARWEAMSAELQIRSGIIRTIANEYKAIFVPLWDILREKTASNPPELFSDDGIHPNNAGLALIAEEWKLAVVG